MTPPWVTVPAFSGRTFKMRLNVAAGAEYSEMATGTYDREALHLLVRTPQSSMVVWDVGAHTGYASLMLASDLCVREVHAFEPHPGNAARLRENVAENGSPVTVHEVALSDENGLAEMQIFPDIDALQGTGGYLAGIYPPLDRQCYSGFVDHSVFVRKGDSLVGSENADKSFAAPVPDIVKIDVEGAELKVLEGLFETLHRRLPITLLEVHSTELQASCEWLLRSWGYRVQSIRILGGGRAHLLATA